MNEIEKAQAMAYWYIEQCRQTNAEAFRLELKGVHHKGEPRGDWELIVRKIGPGMLGLSSLERITKWAVSDDTGLSSEYLASCAIGDPNESVHYPLDPSDFGRCYRLMQILSDDEQFAALDRAAKESTKWATIGVHWAELVQLYLEEKDLDRAPKLYARMKELGL